VTDVAKISSCVDCETTIIGDRLRCPACNDQHTASLLASGEDVTLPRDRVPRKSLSWRVVLPLLGAVQLAIVGVILVVSAAKGCR
jgi:hypothetical protein